ncbi:solute carrier family 66 member 3-like [Tubulanus polymorphus]|uniref:solute carrier family 66 member 3-like n=1 Tax=Tubulanus polymorphus TaxID=672921 RepID=UPI003DA2EB36
MDTKAVCDMLGAAVVIACLFLKVPQIYNILKSGSSKGLSLPSVMMEFWCYTVNLTYGLANSYPLSTYFEYTLLVLQDVIVLILIVHYRKMFQPFMLFGAVVYLALSISIALGFWPKVIMGLIISMNMPMICGSKLTQFYKIYSSKKAGQVSLVSWSIASCTSGTRIVTTLLLTGDVVLMSNFVVGFLLNLTNAIAIIYYGRVDKKRD